MDKTRYRAKQDVANWAQIHALPMIENATLGYYISELLHGEI